jgi:hypothetical protein
MRGGWLRYRCRTCGETYDHLHTPDVAVAVAAIAETHDHVYRLAGCGFVPGLFNTHYCLNGLIGLADFTGARLDTKEDKP